MASIRQPIVSVLGHVDHGKTTLLDRIRGTGVAGREAGGITQHIGATEVPLAAILEMCGDLVKGRSFQIPGLLFIDTPGHVAFSTLRARGGALAHLAVIPVSAKFGEGIPDLLLTLIGLAQRFLGEQLATAEGPAVGTILEVKEEKGVGTTLDAIIYEGTLSKGEAIVFGTAGKPGTTKVKALLKPKPLDEIRDPQERFDSVKSASAASGVKIVGSGLEKAVAGAPIRAVKGDLAAVIEEVAKESQVHIETQDEGILVKADAIGSLEGLAYESKQASIPIKFARIGPVSRRDVTDAATAKNPLNRAILAFNLEILPDAKTALREHPDLKLLENDVIYHLIEDYEAWRDERKRQLAEAGRKEIAYPAKLLFLGEHVFRASKPAIFGVRVLAGRIRPGESVMRADGRPLGRIKAIRSGEKNRGGSKQGHEVAV